jgi:hypothetical protein
MSLVEVGHLAGEQLDVGAADPNPFHLDHDLTRAGHRRVDVIDSGIPRTM